jgi:hypothetical protein
MPRYSKDEAAAAVKASSSYSEALRRLGMRPAGGNHAVIRKYVDTIWRIPTDHFDPYARLRSPNRTRWSLEEILVRSSSYCRRTLKKRLLDEGIKSSAVSSADRETSGGEGIWR